jgi:4-amino-4-deoxy-L-arabinose transferase-like glycosyltransferase
MSESATFRLNSLAGLIVIVVSFVGLAVYYSVATPIFEKPDELQHVAFVAWLDDVGSFPQIGEDLGPWRQEGAQAPFYYWLAAITVGQVSHAPANELAERNPHANIGEPLRPDNKNYVLHDPEQERWPYRGTALFVHLLRALSTVMAAGTLAAIYCLGRITFPDRIGIALGMTGVVAFTPQFIFLSSAASNDNAVILFSSWVLVLLASWLRAPRLPGWLQLGAIGALLGVAVLSKLGGLLLWPLAAAVILVLAWRSKNLGWLLQAAMVVFGLALLLSGWWFVRNQHLYGEFTGSSALVGVMGGPRDDLPSGLGGALAEFRGFRYSLWAVFGWFNIVAPQLFYWIVDALVVLGAAGFLIFLLRSLGECPRFTRDIVLMQLGWLAILSAANFRWATLASSQGRLAFPALGAMALVLVVGWAEVIPTRFRRPVGIAGLAAWAATALLCAALVIKPAYALPERVESLDGLAKAPSDLHVYFHECCELVGYIPPEGPVHPDDWVPLTLVWRATAPMDTNYSLFIHARTADAQLVGQMDTYQGRGMYPTTLWRPGEIIADTIRVPLDPAADTPSMIQFYVGMYNHTTMEDLPAFSAEGVELESIIAGEAALIPARWPEVEIDGATNTVFEEQIQLASVELPQQPIQPGEAVTVTLRWHALELITEDFTGFVHLLAPSGDMVAQDDHPAQDGRFPTRLWSQGAVLSDPFHLVLPADLAEGNYELWGGLYRPESVRRIEAIRQSTGERWKDDLVWLGTLTVASPDGQ